MKTTITPQPKWRSKGAWTSVFVLAGFLLKNYGLLAPIGLTPESYQTLTTLIFAAVMGFGFFNDASDGGKY